MRPAVRLTVNDELSVNSVYIKMCIRAKLRLPVAAVSTGRYTHYAVCLRLTVIVPIIKKILIIRSSILKNLL